PRAQEGRDVDSTDADPFGVALHLPSSAPDVQRGRGLRGTLLDATGTASIVLAGYWYNHVRGGLLFWYWPSTIRPTVDDAGTGIGRTGVGSSESAQPANALSSIDCRQRVCGVCKGQLSP